MHMLIILCRALRKCIKYTKFYSNGTSDAVAPQDCDEVFKFYEAEYAKMIERWEKVSIKDHICFLFVFVMARGVFLW